MKTIALTQARTSSSRLPGKVLLKIGTKTLLQIHLERIQKAKTIDRLIVAIADEAGKEKIIDICNQVGVDYYIGSVNDVLDRFYKAALPHAPDFVVRVTSDCPLIDAEIIDLLVNNAKAGDYDYYSNSYESSFPHGFDAEILKFNALKKAWKEDKNPENREHVSPYISLNSNLYGKDLFKAANYLHEADYSQFRLTVDYSEDYELIKHLVEVLGDQLGWFAYTQYLIERPEIANINSNFHRSR